MSELKDKLILVVDDETRMITFMRMNLELEGARVISASNGRDALDQAREEMPDVVLLDNMPPAVLREAVRKRNAVAPHVELEASGGINLQTVRAVAVTGVERISSGALTHSALWWDVGLDWL